MSTFQRIGYQTLRFWNLWTVFGCDGKKLRFAIGRWSLSRLEKLSILQNDDYPSYKTWGFSFSLKDIYRLPSLFLGKYL
ncbi:unnamed protein product [Lathyrus sativus]|nr:unnamed protein product [Lathyrus sativus]